MPPRTPPLNTPRAKRRAAVIAIVILCLMAVNMTVIFLFSAEGPTDSGERSAGVTDAILDLFYPDFGELTPAEQVSLRSSVHHAVRKLAHFLEFALLGCLAAALTFLLSRRFPRLQWWMQLAIPALFCLLYAASDEFHQRFTGRGAALFDVFIDFAGALFGIAFLRLVILLAAYFSRRRREKGGTP